MSERNQYSRRNALKKAGSLSLGGAFASLALSNVAVFPVAAEDTPDEEWSKNDSDEIANTWDVGLYHSSAVGWFGADWLGGGDGWGHDFRVSSTTSSRDTQTDYSVPAIDEQSWWLTDGTTQNMYVSVHDKYTGVHPEVNPPDEFDHTQFALAVAREAITKLSSLATFAFSAADIAAKYVVDQGNQNGSHAHDNIWSYNSLQPDTSFFRWIKACTDSQDSFFDIGTDCIGNYDLSAKTRYTFKIHGDYVPSEGTISNLSTHQKTRTSMGTTLFRPKQGWLVERIPYPKIAARTEQLGISEWAREQHLAKVGKPMYYAHQAPITLVE